VGVFLFDAVDEGFFIGVINGSVVRSVLLGDTGDTNPSLSVMQETNVDRNVRNIINANVLCVNEGLVIGYQQKYDADKWIWRYLIV
jgi:hypothetical protein